MLSSSLAPLAWDVGAHVAAPRSAWVRKRCRGAAALQPLLTSLAEADDAARLDGVNRFFNRRIAFRDDLQVWHVEDYWASPLETLQQGMGDCEDFAIAKYFSLLGQWAWRRRSCAWCT